MYWVSGECTSLLALYLARDFLFFSFPWILKLLGHWACPTLVIGVDVHWCFLGRKLSVERSVCVVCVCVCMPSQGRLLFQLSGSCKFCPSLFAFIWTLLDARKSLLMKAFALKQSASILKPHISISPYCNQVR